jgi:TPR repeat protein
MRPVKFSLLMLLFAVVMAPVPRAEAQVGAITREAADRHESDCRAGDSEACWVVGRWHRGGIRLPQDLPRARDLLSIGCGRGHEKSCIERHELDLEFGGAQQKATAVSYFSARCDRGDAGRCLDLGARFAEGKDVPVDLARARTLFDKACDLDDARACLTAGVLAAEGKGGPVDGARPVAALERACRGGQNDACMVLQAIARQGRVVPANGAMAISAAETACARNHVEACLAAATVAYHGMAGLAVDAERVRRNADRACELKDARGCLMLESLAREGRLAPADPVAASEASRRGCALGSQDACTLQVVHAMETADKEKIGQALLQACHVRLADACVALAEMLRVGDGVPKNTLGADLYLRRALEIDPSHEGAKAAQQRLKSS